MDIVFSSKVPKQCRSALEELLFFNPRQYRVREGIRNSMARFGALHLEEKADTLSVEVGAEQAQTLFAYDRNRRSPAPVGAVTFLRTSPEEMAILHVAVHPRYGLQSRRAELGLGVALVEKVKEIAAQIVGIQRIVFFYRQEVVLRIA